MLGGHMLDHCQLGFKGSVAFPTRMTISISAVSVMLPSPLFSPKVAVAVIAGPMEKGILFVLL
jgi:hypothetical protein